MMLIDAHRITQFSSGNVYQWFSKCGLWTTLPGNLLEMQTFGPHTKLTESEILTVGPSHLLFIQTLRTTGFRVSSYAVTEETVAR